MGWGYRWSGEVWRQNCEGRQLQHDIGNRSEARGRGILHHNLTYQRSPGEPDTCVTIRVSCEPCEGHEEGRAAYDRRAVILRERGTSIGYGWGSKVKRGGNNREKAMLKFPNTTITTGRRI